MLIKSDLLLKLAHPDGSLKASHFWCWQPSRNPACYHYIINTGAHNWWCHIASFLAGTHGLLHQVKPSLKIRNTSHFFHRSSLSHNQTLIVHTQSTLLFLVYNVTVNTTAHQVFSYNTPLRIKIWWVRSVATSLPHNAYIWWPNKRWANNGPHADSMLINITKGDK